MSNIHLTIFIEKLKKSISSHFKLSLVTAFLLVSLPIQAENIASVSLGDELTIKSKVLNEERTIVIHKPQGYDVTNDHYPVIYLLDGDHNLLYTAGITDYLQKNQLMPKVIVVAINNIDRVRDFTPTPSKELYGMPQMGGADKFLSFIAGELKPLINKQYRTAPYSILAGHSYGGILSIYSQQVRPSLFNAHIAISPSIFYDERALIKSAEVFYKNDRTPPHFLYMTAANEYPEFVNSIKAYAEVLKLYAPDTMQWKLTNLPEETHLSSLHHGTFEGLKLLYKNWFIKDIAALLVDGNLDSLKKYYQNLSSKFSYQIEPPSEMLIAAGYYFLANKRTDEAIEVFEINADRYANSGSGFFHLAQAYQAKQQKKLAKQLTIKACRIATQFKELGSAMFCDRAKALEQVNG